MVPGQTGGGMRTFLFVGERPSPTAIRMGVTWKDGRLAAKQLFDALLSNGIDPSKQVYDNIFTAQDKVCPRAVRRIRRAFRQGMTVVAMGQRVGAVFSKLGLAHKAIVHPAARGRIRKKSRYSEHLR